MIIICGIFIYILGATLFFFTTLYVNGIRTPEKLKNEDMLDNPVYTLGSILWFLYLPLLLIISIIGYVGGNLSKILYKIYFFIAMPRQCKVLVLKEAKDYRSPPKMEME